MKKSAIYMKHSYLLLLYIMLIVSFLNSCKKEHINNDEKNHKFSVYLNGKYWGTDTLTSKISMNQVFIENSKFRFLKICFEYWQAWYLDIENGYTYFTNLTLTIINIDSINFTYSATFTGSFVLSDSLITLEGKIEQAEYYPKYCATQYNYSEVDTFSLFGYWYLIGYKEYNSNDYNYPPCLLEPEPYIEFRNKNEENNQFLGVFITNFYGGNFIVISSNTLKISNFGHSMVYNCWNFDRSFENDFFETMNNENIDYSITNNVLTIENSTNGKKYFFYKRFN